MSTPHSGSAVTASRRPSLRRAGRTLLAGLLAGAHTGALVGAVAGQSSAAADPQRVISRDVVFTLTNHNDTSVPCLADGEDHTVAARLVGPREEVLGHAGSTRIHVLVHDAGTGGWFWNLQGQRRYDYAGRLAKRGETSLILDRLGFDASPLADGRATCLGAQATMLHQVVQLLIWILPGREAVRLLLAVRLSVGERIFGMSMMILNHQKGISHRSQLE